MKKLLLLPLFLFIFSCGGPGEKIFEDDDHWINGDSEGIVSQDFLEDMQKNEDTTFTQEEYIDINDINDSILEDYNQDENVNEYNDFENIGEDFQEENNDIISSNEDDIFWNTEIITLDDELSCENIDEYLSQKYSWYYWNTCRPFGENGLSINILSLNGEEYLYERHYFEHNLNAFFLLEGGVGVDSENISEKNTELKETEFEKIEKAERELKNKNLGEIE